MTEKPTLFLLPGLLCDETVWRHQMEHLSDMARVVVPDYRDCDALAAMADQVLEQAPARFAVAGHSMGGRVALEIMRKARERVTRLALLDTATHPTAESEYEKRLGWVDLARREGMGALVDVWLPPMVHPDRRDDGELMQPLRAMVEGYTPDQFAGEIRALLERPDATPVLDTITCPTLVLCGRQDAWSTLEIHEKMAAAIAGSHLEVIEDCGHFSPIERPRAVTEALRAWLGAAQESSFQRPS
jgi:pimeloyl-ACP methyl ester carboxylesterase